MYFIRRIRRPLIATVVVFVICDIFVNLTSRREKEQTSLEELDFLNGGNNTDNYVATSERGSTLDLNVDKKYWKKTNAEVVRQRLEEKRSEEHDREIVHGIYWEFLARIRANSSAGVVLDPQKAGELQRIFRDRSLWGEERIANPFKSEHEYEWRVLGQLVWQYVGMELYPDLVNSPAKSIALREGYKWWNYDGDRELRCPGSFNEQCVILGGDAISTADAVISVRDAFHASPVSVPRNTSHIYYMLESPFASPKVFLRRRQDFLAAYYRQSEMPTMYGVWAYYDPSIRQLNQTRNYADGKTKMAAIFISNCFSLNDRLNYVKELKKYMDVDVYGYCGDHRCVKGRHDCYGMLKKEYKFYLAFENTNCRDYITEKFFLNALAHNVVPVVLGGHPNDYQALAPQMSYIHVEDHENPQELARYLVEVAGDDEMYNKYFQWKGTGEFLEHSFLCRICAMLWYADVHPPPARRSQFSWHPRALVPSGRMCVSHSWYWGTNREARAHNHNHSNAIWF